MTKDEALVTALRHDWREAPLQDADRAMLQFVDRLTRAPQQMGEPDVDRLRQHGFDDRAIHDIVVVAAYYAFVNRVADGLGVTLEPGWQRKEAP